MAAVFIVMANVVDGAERLPTLFLVDRDTPGIELVDDPPFTHAYPHGHPTVRFDGVEVPADAVIGGVGAGDELQRAWFTEERLGIAARGLGAMWRLLEESVAWATARQQGGARRSAVTRPDGTGHALGQRAVARLFHLGPVPASARTRSARTARARHSRAGGKGSTVEGELTSRARLQPRARHQPKRDRAEARSPSA